MKNLFKYCVILTLAGVVSMPVFAQTVVNPNVTALLPQPVFDMKTYNGSQCEAYEVWDTDKVQNQVDNNVTKNGPLLSGTHISASLPTWIVCPIVRDNTTNTNGVRVNVNIGNVAGQTFECHLVSSSTHGATVQKDIKSKVVGGNQTLFLGVNNSTNGGSYSLMCLVPRDAWLFSYTVREFSNPGVGTANTDNNN